MQKRERQNAVLSVIDRFLVSNQSELAQRLNADGFSVTQASISRDLDELGVIKLNGHYSRPAAASTGSALGEIRLEAAGDNLIVGRCLSGLASAITVKIDAAAMPEIVGTIAGDDTIFIAVRDIDARRSAFTKIQEMFR